MPHSRRTETTTPAAAVVCRMGNDELVSIDAGPDVGLGSGCPANAAVLTAATKGRRATLKGVPLNRYELVSLVMFLLFVLMSGLSWVREDAGQLALFGVAALAFLLRLVGHLRQRGELRD